MKADFWPTKRHSVASLHLDAKNPRLGREATARAPREIIQHLFQHDSAIEVAQSIAARGYFPNEPLLAIIEDNLLIVVEGNRRLAALKALREPALLDLPMRRRIERLLRQIEYPKDLATVPVTIAPNRRATDRQIAGRHIGAPVLAWQAENRASFILEKLSEGYSNAQLRDSLGFTSGDIQAARQTRAVADMARSLDLPDDVKAKLENPRANMFTTLERVFSSSVGRAYLNVVPDPDHGLRGVTTKNAFLRIFTKLVTDVARGDQSSRTLNTNENIDAYFRSWRTTERPRKQGGTFLPADIITGRNAAPPARKPAQKVGQRKAKSPCKTVLPRDFRVRFGNERLVDIRLELTKLRREDFPNAGAVLLRVFFELAVLEYLERTGELPRIIERLEKKSNGHRLPFGTPTMKQLVPEIMRIAKSELSPSAALKVNKAIRYDASAPFTLSELHGFVHQSDLPSARDIQQFWNRTEPLFRLMLEQENGRASE